MSLHVSDVVVLHDEVLRADFATKRALLVGFFVFLQIVRPGEPLIADIAAEVFRAAVRGQVAHEVLFSGERFRAVNATERPDARVEFRMLVEVFAAFKSLFANVAFKNLRFLRLLYFRFQ